MLTWLYDRRALRQLIAGLLAMTVWGWGWLHAYVGKIDHSRLQYSTYLLAEQGELLHVLLAADERLRIRTEQAHVDGHYLDLLMAYEDQRFWQHNGVDWLAMLRAVGQLISHGYVVSGGSTLTMQTVRLLEPKPRTVWNKLDQMRKALALERQFSKADILQKYLTLAPFGGNVEGVNAASLVWFNKWPSALTPAEAALLVALPQSPEARRPDRFPGRAQQARHNVLHRALEKGVISAAYMHMANLSAVPTQQRKLTKLAPHLAWYREHRGDLTSQTTVDADLQARLAALAKNTAIQAGLNMAILVVESQTGKVKAYIGSQDYYDFNRFGAVDYIRATRSPGSTLKPFVYGLAAAHGDIYFDTMIDDSVTNIDGYQPQNMANAFSGSVSVAKALQRSLNIPAVKVMQRYGAEKFQAKLAATGIQLSNAQGLPTVLGGAGIRLYDLVSLYSALGNQGLVSPLSSYHDISLPGQRLLPANTVAQLNWILSNNSGSSGRLHGAHSKQAVAFKTGTGPGGSDALALATNGRYTFGVWVGTPDGSHRANNTGLSSAVPIMANIIDILPQSKLPTHVIAPAPIALRRFDRPVQELEMIYPLDGSVLHYKAEGLRVPLDIKGARYPLWVSVNGLSLQHIQAGNSSLKLLSRGGYNVTIVDSRHKTAAVNFYVD
ncbi:MAG: penicillin-binding protein 1C [Gammaproteobacteria bacterium]|nr:penicillin-binding protein 1C [Gammaproteobacteria bacterium]